MQIRFTRHGREWQADLAQPIDLAIPLRDGLANPNAFWAPAPVFSPVRAGDFVGSTAEGGPVNFFDVRINPHGNGTHTECVGHIARERFVLHECLADTHAWARLASLYPQRTDGGDRVILRAQLEEVLQAGEAEAFILRTLPNDAQKRTRTYSGSNPPYLEEEAARYLADCGVRHLLLDLPSVDREEDEGRLLAHRAFWRYPEAVRRDCTITEMIFAPDTAPDGFYLLNLQIAAIELDASPSRPVLFAVQPV